MYKRLKNILMKTYEWKSIITEYDTHLGKRLNVKDEYLTEKITEAH